MSGVISRVRNRIQSTATKFWSDCSFSVYLGMLRIVDELGGRIGLGTLSSWAHGKKDRWVIDYLKKCISSVMEHYKEVEVIGTKIYNAPIWVCWWSGAETAPPLVRKCISSIRFARAGRPIYLITKDSYSKYLEIPPYIMDKVISGKMCIANFSDYLRFSLLEKYGGVWLDATIFCSSSLPKELLELPVFTCKGPVRIGRYISEYRWTSFCFGGYSNNPLFSFMREAFEVYWRNNKVAIDYLLVDYLIKIAYEEIPLISMLLDNIPDNNIHRDDLQAAMNAALPASQFDSVIQSDTVLYKLSWRESYSEFSQNGEESVYAHFVK